jgi:hypothetical protein
MSSLMRDARLRADTRGREGGVREEVAAGIGRVLINAQIAAGYALTLRLRGGYAFLRLRFGVR